MTPDGAGRVAPHVALRAATDAVHRRLHRVPLFDDLAAGRLDRSGYTALLGRLLGFHEPVEAALTACLGDAAFGLELRTLRRGPLLRDDLATLGLDPAAIAALPRCGAPAFATPAAAMGAVYVTEGATLGGRILARGLDRLLGPEAEAGRRFLLAGADPGRPAWWAVRAAIDRSARDPQALAALIDGAARTFAAFADWFGTHAEDGGQDGTLFPGAAFNAPAA